MNSDCIAQEAREQRVQGARDEGAAGGFSSRGGAVLAWADCESQTWKVLWHVYYSFCSLFIASFFIICMRIILYSPMQHPLEHNQASHTYYSNKHTQKISK